MKTNDLKKGVRVKLQNGWEGTVMDNKKGNTRMVEVEGHYTEIGSVYAHDIKLWKNTETGLWEQVEHTADQVKLKERLKSMGW